MNLNEEKLEVVAKDFVTPDREHDITPEHVAAVINEHVGPLPTFTEKDIVAEDKDVIKPTDLPVIPGVEKAPIAATSGLFGGLDPLTAGFNAAAAFFNFLSTEQGQRICKDIIDLDEFFVKKVKEVFDKIHDKVQKG